MEATLDKETTLIAPFGRAAEVELLGAFLRRAAEEGETLLIVGEPGTGKTLLLDTGVEMAAASGAFVLRARGVESEADVGFSALNQMVWKLLAYLPELDHAAREALEVALGLDAGAPPDLPLVSTAMLVFLCQARAITPLLIVIDDLPCVDRLSAEVLGFVARRVSGSRIGFLGAARPGDDGFFDRSGLPEHALGPLPKAAAGELVASRFPGLAAEVRARVLAEAGGNPLALLELPAALSDAQRTAAAVLPAALPLTGRLREAFAPRIAGLPAPARRLLLLAALDGTGDPRVTAAPGALDATARARLLHLDEQGRLAFAHPLVRSAAVELASDDEQRAAHRELAALFSDQPDRRTWHLAGAARQPDEHLAAALEQAAHHSLQRGDAVQAAAELTRASQLSEAAAGRLRRLARSTLIGLAVTAELSHASRLLAYADSDGVDGGGSLEVGVVVAYLMMNHAGGIDEAHRLLIETFESLPDPPDEALLQEALSMLLMLCHFGGRAELWQPFYRLMERLEPKAAGTLSLLRGTFADPASATGPARQRLAEAVDGLANELDPVRILQVSTAAEFMDQTAGCRAALSRVVEDGQAGGAMASAIGAQTLLGVDDFHIGCWDRAQARAHEVISWCDQHRYLLFGWRARFILAAVAAGRGDYASARALTADMLDWAGPRRIRQIQCLAWEARSLAAIGNGDFEDARRYAALISPPGQLASHVPTALYVALDLVEACLRTNRQGEAAAHVTAMEAAGIEKISPRLRLVVSGCAAIAADDASAAIDRFSAALAIPEAERWPFDLARVQLLYGEHLRRAGATREARQQLHIALERFQLLGARPWTARAQDELRATGQSSLPAAASGVGRLTPRERQVAALAASGLRNKEIADRLVLSERTVAAHLHRAFPKLGVTSRAGLRDALDLLV